MDQPAGPRGPEQREPGRGEPAQPADVGRLFLERLNAGDGDGDGDGAARMYEADAVLALPDGSVAVGRAAIGAFYRALVADRPVFQPGTPGPVLRAGDLALTTTRLANGDITVEVVRRQPDGGWRWGKRPTEIHLGGDRYERKRVSVVSPRRTGAGAG